MIDSESTQRSRRSLTTSSNQISYITTIKMNGYSKNLVPCLYQRPLRDRDQVLPKMGRGLKELELSSLYSDRNSIRSELFELSLRCADILPFEGR